MSRVLIVLAAACCVASCGDFDERPALFDCAKENCEDCAVIDARLQGESSYNFDRQSCESCQAQPCGASGCAHYPCFEGKVVVRSCNVDSDCAGISPFCGQYASTHNICVEDDPI